MKMIWWIVINNDYLQIINLIRKLKDGRSKKKENNRSSGFGIESNENAFKKNEQPEQKKKKNFLEKKGLNYE